MKWQCWSIFDCNMILVAQVILAHMNSPIKCNFIPSHPILLRLEQTFIWMKLLNKYCRHVILSERPAMGLLSYALMPCLAYALTVSGRISTSQGHWIYSPEEVLLWIFDCKTILVWTWPCNDNKKEKQAIIMVLQGPVILSVSRGGFHIRSIHSRGS